jgi:hypothetical protein
MISGEAASVITCIEGYPAAKKKGEPARPWESRLLAR